MRLLVGYDGRASSRDALALACLFRQVEDVELVIGVVLPDRRRPAGSPAHEERIRSASAALFAEACSQLESIDPALVPECRAIGERNAAEGLRALALSESVDMIVVGSTHRGPIGGIVPGRTADGLIARAPCAFAVAPRDYAESSDRDLRIVGLAFDGSREAERAAGVARWLALRSVSALRAFGVVEPVSHWVTPGVSAPPLNGNLMREHIAEALDELIRALPQNIGAQRLMLSGDPANELVNQGLRAVDVMVFGSHGFGRAMRAIAGSVTSRVIRSAPWPVIVVPPQGRLPSGVESSDQAAETAETGSG